MRFEFAAFRPLVSLIVVAHVAEQEAPLAPVNDKSDVAINPHRPEILILHLVELVEAHAWICRVELQVEGRRLDSLLLLAREPSQAVGEGIGDAKIHIRALPLKSCCRARRTGSDQCNIPCTGNPNPAPTLLWPPASADLAFAWHCE